MNGSEGGPLWTCGHHHWTRGEALACLASRGPEDEPDESVNGDPDSMEGEDDDVETFFGFNDEDEIDFDPEDDDEDEEGDDE